MAYIRKFTATVTTDGSGDGIGYTDEIDQGYVVRVQYVKHGSTPFSDGVNVTITGKDSGVGILTEANLNASGIRFPLGASHKAADGAVTGNNDMLLAIFGEKIKVVVASGGDTKTGQFIFYVA